MLELIKSGVNNIVCVQPFGCLPNHIVGKGVIKELRYANPKANIIAVDYDPGASEVNFTPPSRIKDLAVMANDFVSLGNQTGEVGILTGGVREQI